MPIAVAQALWVRARTEMVPPAQGPAAGTVTTDDSADERDPWRIAVLGESTAAGCGVDSHDDGFPGALSRIMAGRIGRPVAWSVVGRHGATARRIRYKLLPQLDEKFDAAVLLAGVNDVLSRRAPQDWGDDLTAIVDDLAARSARVVVAGIPPFDAFPAIPGTLGRFLAERAATLDAVSRRVCADRPAASWVDAHVLLPAGADFFCRDRFHPSAGGYQRWAGAVADHLVA